MTNLGSSLLLPLAVVAVLLAWTPQAARGDFTATVLHTNDVHGRFEQIAKSGTRCTEKAASANECVGGIARQKTLVGLLVVNS
ncbi:protein 5NUC-like [Haemaphysalis longicornis]